MLELRKRKYDNVAVIYYRGSAEKDDTIRKYLKEIMERNNEFKPDKRHYDFMFADCYLDTAFTIDAAIDNVNETVSEIIDVVKCCADDKCKHGFMLVLIVKCVDEYFDKYLKQLTKEPHGKTSLQHDSCGVKWITDVETNDTDTIVVHQYCSDKNVCEKLIYIILSDLISDNSELLNNVDEDSTAISQLIFLMTDILCYYDWQR